MANKPAMSPALLDLVEQAILALDAIELKKRARVQPLA
jgi:hypothetical protein